MCACDESGSCPACAAEDRWWLKVEYGEDERLEREQETLRSRTESFGEMRDPKEALR